MLFGEIKIRNGEVLIGDYPLHERIKTKGINEGDFCKYEPEDIHYKGYIECFWIDEKKYHKNMKEEASTKPVKPTERKDFTCNPNRESAHAPYNFIPLNSKPVPAETSSVSFSQYSEDRHSGYLELKLTALSPIFSRGDKDKFFEIDGKPAIPGSSLRGMVRNLCEIMGHGYFRPGQSFENQRFYNRSMAAKSDTDIKDYYEWRQADTQSGYLNYHPTDRRYYIRPASEKARQMEKTSEKSFEYDPGKEKKYWKVYTGLLGKTPKKQWIIFPPDLSASLVNLSDQDKRDYEEDKQRKSKGPMANVFKECRKTKDYPDGLPIFYCEYEDSKGEKRYSVGHTCYFRIAYDLDVADHVPQALREDADLPDLCGLLFGQAGGDKENEIIAGRLCFEDVPLSSPSKAKTGLPQILSGPKPTSFQLYLKQDPCFEKMSENHLKHWGTPGAEIRGYKMYWHREEGDLGKERETWENEKPLLPFDLFTDHKEAYRLIDQYPEFLELESKQGKFVLLKNKFESYPQKLRSRLNQVFFPKNKNARPSQFTPISVLPKSTRFKSRIHFENLSEVELGLLLTALDLQEGMAHKIGMGKPIGLGSVRIEPLLHLHNRKTRYASLFGEQGNEWCDGEKEQNDFAPYKTAFWEYLKRHLDLPEELSGFWEIENMKHLKTMLKTGYSTNKKTWIEATSYLDFSKNKEAYRNRHVLPYPDKVAGK